jgi:hypothetical protein
MISNTICADKIETINMFNQSEKTEYNKQHQTFAILQADGKLTIYGYDKLGRQDRSYLGALVDVTKGEYKIEALPLNEEFDIYITKNNTDIHNLGCSRDCRYFFWQIS